LSRRSCSKFQINLLFKAESNLQRATSAVVQPGGRF
jgi:hypothetical protein